MYTFSIANVLNYVSIYLLLLFNYSLVCIGDVPILYYNYYTIYSAACYTAHLYFKFRDAHKIT